VDDYFAKKQECSKYQQQVEQEVDDIKENTGNSSSQPEVFYSPKLDTCVSTWTLSNKGDFRAFEIRDILTKEQIYFKGYLKEQILELSKQGLTGFEEFSAKKEELKGK
jgi:hypothetical protein